MKGSAGATVNSPVPDADHKPAPQPQLTGQQSTFQHGAYPASKTTIQCTVGCIEYTRNFQLPRLCMAKIPMPSSPLWLSPWCYHVMTNALCSRSMRHTRSLHRKWTSGMTVAGQWWSLFIPIPMVLSFSFIFLFFSTETTKYFRPTRLLKHSPLVVCLCESILPGTHFRLIDYPSLSTVLDSGPLQNINGVNLFLYY